MKPYFEAGGITIYHGDCREILPTLGSYDIALTDPPYGMAYQSNRYEGGNPFGKIVGDGDYPVDVLGHCLMVARKAVLAFCRWENIKDLPKPKSFIVWAKNSHTAGDLDHEYGRQWEAIAFWPGKDHKFADGRPTDVIDWRRVPAKELSHPTEKPLGLVGAILRQHEGETVVDPFMGSGTTLRAAKDLGRRAIGIEVEERYCEVAAKRMAQESLFQSPPDAGTSTAGDLYTNQPDTGNAKSAKGRGLSA